MKNLLPGLRKFSESVFAKHKVHFASLAHSQNPHTLLITCSDSRIDPNLVTQTKPGEIFVIRNAGNIIPPFGSSHGGEEAAIEFAIEGLGVCNIVICGHTQCGAMSALNEDINLDKLPSLRRWLSHAYTTKKRIEALEQKCSLTTVIEENILAQADNLRTHPSVSGALKAGRIQIFGWVYNFESGFVTIYDPQNKNFIISTEVKEEAGQDVTRFAI